MGNNIVKVQKGINLAHRCKYIILSGFIDFYYSFSYPTKAKLCRNPNNNMAYNFVAYFF